MTSSSFRSLSFVTPTPSHFLSFTLVFSVVINKHVSVPSVQSVWISTIRMTLGTKVDHLGVLVNLFPTHLLLRNGNLFCLFLTLNRTSLRLLLVSFKHSVTWFSPNPISVLLPGRNLISNSLYYLLWKYLLRIRQSYQSTLLPSDTIRSSRRVSITR